MRKIAFIIGSLAPGGAEKVCVNISNFLIDKGYDISLYVKPNNDEIVYEINNRIKILTLKMTRAADRKCKIRCVSLFFSGLSYVKSLFDALKGHNPDVIISFGVGLNGISIFVAKLLGKPIIVSEHTNHNFHNFYKYFITRRILYKYANIVTVLTEYDYKYYSKSLSNLIIVRNPIEAHRDTHIVVIREKSILCAGTVSSWKIKGFDRMLDIMSIVIKKHPDWVLKIAGRGHSSFLASKIKELELERNVILLGLIPNMDYEFSKAGIFALPSRTEGLPMVLIEAMSNSCPSISFDIVSGPNEMIVTNKTGILVKDNDIEGFANAIINLIDNHSLRNTIGENAFITTKSYSIEEIGQQWLKMLDSVLNKSN